VTETIGRPDTRPHPLPDQADLPYPRARFADPRLLDPSVGRRPAPGQGPAGAGYRRGAPPYGGARPPAPGPRPRPADPRIPRSGPRPGPADPRLPATRPVPATATVTATATAPGGGRHERAQERRGRQGAATAGAAAPAPRGRHERAGGHESWQETTARRAAAEDERLLAALQPLLSLPSLYPRLVFLALGFAAITSLAAAYSEMLPLPAGARFMLVPAVACILLTGFRHRTWGRRALVGWLAGIIATGIYDMLRLGLVLVGTWDDPIPRIGQLLFLDPDANWLWGYVWRFLGNGGGMGLAFAMLPWRGVRFGIAYGTLICLGLFGVLAIWPVAQVHFFPLTPVVGVGAMAGHWVYGAVLGALTTRWLPPARLPAAGARAAAERTDRAARPGAARPGPAHPSGRAGAPRTATGRGRPVRPLAGPAGAPGSPGAPRVPAMQGRPDPGSAPAGARQRPPTPQRPAAPPARRPEGVRRSAPRPARPL